jgi:hypothetical protein
MAQDDITLNGGNGEKEQEADKLEVIQDEVTSGLETGETSEAKPVPGDGLSEEAPSDEGAVSKADEVLDVNEADVAPALAERETTEPVVSESGEKSENSEEENTPEPAVEAANSDASDAPVGIEALSESDDFTEEDAIEAIDLSDLDKTGLIALLTKELAFLQKGENLSLALFRKIDGLLKELRPILDHFYTSEQGAALQKFIAENGSEEGFQYRHDPQTAQLEELRNKLKGERGKFFKQLDKAKEDNFNLKTTLLQRLRELVDAEENKESDDSNMKAGWQEFKRIQEEWRAAGNINSPHNGTLWATYNALVDRYFNIRNMFFELKELDRKRNAEVKAELCEKVEAIAQSIESAGFSKQLLDEALHAFEEYKHVGPAPKEEQEKLWQRFKAALDTVYDAKRSQAGELKKLATEVYELKSRIYEEVVPYTAFSSGSINEWNSKTKELLGFQAKWEEIKGGMPREEGKVLSKKFWSALKTFFNNKGDFFRQLEAKREVNLRSKTELCEQAEEILSLGEDIPQNTQRIIELQKRWKTIGQVPEKYKDSIFARFKTACDAYFDKKRGKNQAVEKEFEDNLEKKLALCGRIEELAEQEGANIEQLNAFKAEWKGVGFVPRGEMQNIQKRYIAAINKYVSAIGKLSLKEKEIVLLQSEVDAVKGGDTDRNLYRKENDLRKKVMQLEESILLWQNNIQFFAKSKSSDKLKADFEKKIEQAEGQLADLKHQLKILQEAF